MGRISRKTTQKQLIGKELEKFDRFFTADELFSKVRSKDQDIGIATIYRFLKEAAADNKVHSYPCGRQLAYSRQKSSHCFFICQKCGSKSHFDLPAIHFIKGNIKGEMCHFHIDVHGTCENCLKKNKMISKP